MGVDEVKIKSAQIYDYENGNERIPTKDEFARYKKTENGNFVLNAKLKTQNSELSNCWKMWHSCVITWDGKIVPCCFDKDAKHQLGNLKENKTFKETLVQMALIQNSALLF